MVHTPFQTGHIVLYVQQDTVVSVFLLFQPNVQLEHILLEDNLFVLLVLQEDMLLLLDQQLVLFVLLVTVAWL